MQITCFFNVTYISLKITNVFIQLTDKEYSLYFQCDMAVGTKLFFDMMHKDPPKVMLFGGACTQVTAPLAESTTWWDIWQVSSLKSLHL